MQIVVCIKQVPDTNNIKWTKENNLQREGMVSILNPCDNYALEAAFKIREKFKNAKITALTMGPSQAKNVLNYALARGCDEAVLLCDKAFSASDTLATGRVISSAIKKLFPKCSLIICGQYAQDGDTAQTGPTVAGMLDIPVVTNVGQIINCDIKMSIFKQVLKDGVNILEVKNPSVACVLKGDEPIKPLYVKDYMRSQEIGIKEYDLSDLELDKTQTGILGSPTYVFKAFKLEHQRDAQEIKYNIPDFLINLTKNGGKNG